LFEQAVDVADNFLSGMMSSPSTPEQVIEAMFAE